mmetsp:Transcript_2329/g.3672  ORF Transcript_2329/g.3672 Transcript_2329/m.3672 type:complete len:220 (+) Transcript_2329:56-715(+)
MADAGADSNDHRRCNSMLKTAVTKNGKIQKLIDRIEELGCAIPSDFFACRWCDAEITGGFNVGASQSESSNYKPQIILCENNILEKETFENTIAHELVHAYDICRSNISFKDCKQHACTEIRASNLSGECDILHEVFRGQFRNISGGKADCVSRRAAKSVEMNPNCRTSAKKVVNEVFDSCYSDGLPLRETSTHSCVAAAGATSRASSAISLSARGSKT